MGDKKLVNRTVVIGTAILCVALLISLVGAVITYNSMLDAKDSIIASKDLQIADENAQTSDMEEIANEKQSEIDDLNAQISQINSTISDLNEQISQKNSQISSLNSQISQKDSTIASLNDQGSIIAELNEQISQKDNQISSLTSQISSLTSQVASLNIQISQKNSTIAGLNDQILLLENMTSSLAAEISDLNSQILTLNSQIISLQIQNDDLTSEIAILNSELADLQLAYDNYVAAYQNLRSIVNQKTSQSDFSKFITPQDPSVISIVNNVTGGWSDTSDWNEFWTDYKVLYNWVITNIDYASDQYYPILPSSPEYPVYYITEAWQFPNETLTLKTGDCEDQAILLCSMLRCYCNSQYRIECVVIYSPSFGHVGVQVPVAGGKLVIFDPAGHYYSSDIWGNIVFNDISVEVNNWLNYWGPDTYVYRVFSDVINKTFTSTSEYLSWMYS
jgi:peptidoglycan hydrolase CwlO-like protein